MKSNEKNIVTGDDAKTDALKILGNRIKNLRLSKGEFNYEKFAFENDLNRMTLRRCELGHNVRYLTLLRILKALQVTPAEFFSDGF